jgi:hypothetical protein
LTAGGTAPRRPREPVHHHPITKFSFCSRNRTDNSSGGDGASRFGARQATSFTAYSAPNILPWRLPSYTSRSILSQVATTLWSVRWQLEGKPVAVDIAIGTSADHLDHQHHTTIPPGETSSRVRRIADGRMFVSVACHHGGPAVVAAERRIPFEAVTNFRDLGGYRTRSGRRTRWGRVFRSDALHGMTEGDVAMYDNLGLTAVFDLRGDVEVAEQPDPMPSRHLPMLSRPAGANIASAFNGSTGEDGERLLAGLYIGQIDHSATTIGELFSALAEPDGLACGIPLPRRQGSHRARRRSASRGPGSGA